MLGNRNLDHGIAQKLEALIVKGIVFPFERNARMRERLGEKQPVAEFVQNPLLQRIHDRVFQSFHGH